MAPQLVPAVVDWISIETYDPVRTDADRVALVAGYVFDRRRAKRASDFIQQFCRARAGDHAGETIRLLPWQLEVVWQLFGWVDPESGLRRFREAYVEVAKRNGKSVLLSAIAIYAIVADGEVEPLVMVNATSRDQASIIYKEAVAMVEADPSLRRAFDKVDSSRRLTCRRNGGQLIANSADAPAKDGFDPSVVIFDELHRQPNRKLWDLFEFAQGSRSQPLFFSITTAGDDVNSICYQQHERAVAVLRGRSIEQRFLAIIHGPWDLPDGGKSIDVDDEDAWHRANPSLGYAISIDGFRAEVEKAKQSPESLANFRRLKLGVWTSEAARYFDLGGLAKAGPRRTLEEIAESGDRWYAGYDLASTRDLTASVMVAGDFEKGFDVYCRAWVPAAEAARRREEGRVPYHRWAEAGYLEIVHGERVDYAAIGEALVEDYAAREVAAVYADSYNAALVAPRLLEAGLRYKTIRQGYLSLSPPTKELERLIALGLIRAGGDPVLGWCLGNAAAERDAADNVKLSKKRSREKIDAAAALVNAIAAALDAQATPDVGFAPFFAF